MQGDLDEALRALDVAIRAALELGLRIPCAGRDEWTSELVDELTEAAAACDGCPVMDECRAVIEATPRAGRHGAWAGEVHLPKQPKEIP